MLKSSTNNRGNWHYIFGLLLIVVLVIITMTLHQVEAIAYKYDTKMKCLYVTIEQTNHVEVLTFLRLKWEWHK